MVMKTILAVLGNVLGFAAVFGAALLFATLVLAPMEKTIIACHFVQDCR